MARRGALLDVRVVQEGDMAQRALEQRGRVGHVEELDPEIPPDAERFAVGLEDNRKVHKAWLIAGLVSEAALAGMFVVALGEPGLAWPVVLAVMLLGLGVAMVLHLKRFRLNGKPRVQSARRQRSRLAR
jgi:hypothetical protein